MPISISCLDDINNIEYINTLFNIMDFLNQYYLAYFLVNINPKILNLISYDLINYKEIVLLAIKYDAYAFEYAKTYYELIKDKEFILQAIKINSDILHFDAIRLQYDKEFVLEAVKNNGNV